MMERNRFELEDAKEKEEREEREEEGETQYCNDVIT